MELSRYGCLPSGLVECPLPGGDAQECLQVVPHHRVQDRLFGFVPATGAE